MELWIRSQDKTKITKIDYLYLESNYGLEILGGNSYSLNKALGTYKTKERALEVLDEIQNILKPSFKLDTNSIKENGNSWVENGVIMQNYNANVKLLKYDTYVYEMPEK